MRVFLTKHMTWGIPGIPHSVYTYDVGSCRSYETIWYFSGPGIRQNY